MASALGTPVAGPPAGSLADVELGSLGELTPISRTGGQGRVYVPGRVPGPTSTPLVVKLYRRRPAGGAALTLAQMVAWGRSLPREERRRLYRTSPWPLATVGCGGELAGIVMEDLRDRFELPFVMPSGKVARVMLQLEHLLGPDDFLQQRGQPHRLDTRVRVAILERICGAFALLHRHAIVVSDVSPSNLLIRLSTAAPEVALIDCDSMVFHGRQALASVETGDWQMPPAFSEPPLTRAADAYKLGLIILRVLARSSDANELDPHRDHVPAQLHGLLARALSADARNRPPAGEWQLALGQALADGHLLRSHPGPPPPVRAPPVRAIPGAAERATARSAAAPERRIRPRGAPAARESYSGRLSPGFTGAWLIAGAVALLLFIHLLQASALSQSAAGSAEGAGLRRGGLSTLSPERRQQQPEGGEGSEGGAIEEPGGNGR